MQNLPEIWGGIECTINRVKDTFIDQLDVSGHYARETDIDLVASLGIKSLRFPILWERHEAAKGQVIDWSWSEKSLNKLQQHGISPIVGLVHHGSGPAYTSLQNESFAPGLAAYAAKVAKKYPHIEYYIPVNEPLTTARFSGLYGFWYPHGNSDQDFCFMLINQVKATVLAMQEIRKINPSAKLVQTEDLAKTYSVPSLQYQADFENDRRWISFDLLCSKVNRQHPLWDFFIRAGISEDSLKFFTDNPCPPDILGLNYYVTSERFLDDDLDRYPPHMHGGNWIDRYVDVEAVRVNHGQPSGLRLLINEAQERYGLPMAITECHLNCTAEEKMRWFWEVWNVCCNLSKNGVPIKAVTAWSLFGAHGWETLLTSPDGRYEPGVFDLRGGTPRATALVKLLQTLSTGEDFWHPVLAQKGWWHRSDRFLHPAMGHCYSNMPGDSSPILIVGDGELMHAFVNACNARSLCHHVVDNFDNGVDFTGLLQTEIETFKPWAVVDVSDQSEISALTEEICGLYNLAIMHVAAETDNVYALANASLDLLIDDDKYMNLSQSALILS